jgi:argininosuccinate lyase
MSRVLPRLGLLVATALVAHAALAQDLELCLSPERCQAAARDLADADRGASTSALAGQQTRFYWMNRINMASLVMLSEQGVIPEPLTAPIADGIRYAMVQADAPGGRRPADVMQLEKIIMERAGADATFIHSGRSRQDMYATIRTMQLRQQLLDVIAALNDVRAQVLEIAARHTETFVPAYTNGVQAQPITYAHYLSAFADSFRRDAERLAEAYGRLNRSAMGTAVLANSSWPMNRERLAELLGFSAIVENSYDAGQVSPMDVQFEVASQLANLALRVGALLEDIHVQYHQIRPWLLMDSSATYASSSMPQKRNPGILMNARHSASDVVASLQDVTLRIHNVTPGMTDYKEAVHGSGITVETVAMLERFGAVLAALRIDGKRALAELEAEWTTSMNTAEAMQRLHGTPFRVGHSFASDIVTLARAEGYTPMNFPYEQAEGIYRRVAATYGLTDERLPLTEAEFRASVSPRDMVLSRRGTGSPAPAEVTRMLARAARQLDADTAWHDAKNAELFAAEALLNEAFAACLPD